MILRQFLHIDPVAASYLFGCGGKAIGAVVDPLGDVSPYLRTAKDTGIRIRYVIDTHLHADHMSAGRVLAKMADAEYVLFADANVTFQFRRVRDGDVLIGLASTGLHTNGYSLARRILRERLRLGPQDAFPGGGGTMADVMLAVHRSYLGALRPVLGQVHAMAHITGGGLPGNLDRALPPTLDAVVDLKSWDVPNVFQVLRDGGKVEAMEMYRAFNMGVGMVVLAPADAADAVMRAAQAAGDRAWVMGHVTAGSGKVRLT